MQNRVFFPQVVLDKWLLDGVVDLQGTELTILSEGRRYKLAEAARVLREVTGAPDVNEVVGRVKSVAYLQELGAELVESSMVLGENAYDVVPGWLGAPVGTFDEHVAARPRQASENFGEEPKTDEAMLARFLSGPVRR
jgi:hypothetical protein